ncbi:MAG: hypothetical protein GY927_14605 [bacterium]|nr:hypothetical protein [bacterium]
MNIMLHKNTTTTPRIREEIRNSSDPAPVLVKQYNTTVATARKWQGREYAQDRSHRHTICKPL